MRLFKRRAKPPVDRLVEDGMPPPELLGPMVSSLMVALSRSGPVEFTLADVQAVEETGAMIRVEHMAHDEGEPCVNRVSLSVPFGEA